MSLGYKIGVVFFMMDDDKILVDLIYHSEFYFSVTPLWEASTIYVGGFSIP